jgi:Ca2+-binding EF-hand superfamily protein
MKIIKITILILAFLSFTLVQAQDKKLEMQQKRFAKIDSNSDGSVNQAELDAFYKDKTTKSGEPFKTKKMFKKIDKDKSGTLTLEEYTASFKKEK